MSKQVTPVELAEIVTGLLTNLQRTGQLDTFEAFQSFMTGIAQVVCDHCGGEIRNLADRMEDTWYIGIHGNDSLPDENGGIWKDYDPEGELFSGKDANPDSAA